MARKKKNRSFRRVSAVKALARERIGTPPPAQVMAERKKANRGEKHKRTLARLLEDKD